MNATEIPTNANPLDVDYSQVDVKRAVLAGNLPYNLIVKKCEHQTYGPTSANPGVPFIYVELQNADHAKSPIGEEIAPGQVTIFDRIHPKPFKKLTQKQCVESVAMFQQALGITGPLSQVIASAAGRVVKANVRVEAAGTTPAGKSFPEKNSIGYYMKAK